MNTEKALTMADGTTFMEVKPDIHESPEIFIDRNFTYEFLPIKDINPDNPLPRYVERSRSNFPLIVRDEKTSSLHCIDGETLIEECLGQGKDSLMCHVVTVSAVDVVELAIRRLATRVLPQGGKASYGEIVRGVAVIYMMLKNSGNPFLYSHGGARKGKTFIKNREDDAVRILEERLGKQSSTIHGYLSHGQYLEGDVLESLADAQVPKRFFEAIDKYKGLIEKHYKADRKGEKDINERMTFEMKELLDTYIKERSLKALEDLVKLKMDHEEQKGKIEVVLPKEAEPILFTPEEPALIETRDEVIRFRSELKAYAQRLADLSETRDMNMEELIKGTKEVAEHLYANIGILEATLDTEVVHA